MKAGEKPNKILDTAAEFSGINDAIRAITGRDPVTGDKVAGNDRLVSGLSVVPVAKIYKIGKYVFKLNKGEKAAKKVEKADTSINDAYDVAKSGGKHSGFYKQYIDKSPDQIKKGINSIDKQIAEHRDKIKNPEKHIPNFRNLDPRQQEALINKKWPSDIQRQIEQKQILEGILKLQ
ncbi:pre-toxin TG domain-containing protein [Bacillus safensis]|uniref:pre-toxin TG domain-containing protein n=1 Tax=Bacillus safensis TaxID=561879 RepID=UPI0037444804